MTDWIAIGSATTFTASKPTLVWLADDWPVMIFTCRNVHLAVDARCTHQDQLLTEQDCFAQEAICQLHQARFDLNTGKVTRGPAAGPLTVYPLRTDDNGVVWLQSVTPWWR